MILKCVKHQTRCDAASCRRLESFYGAALIPLVSKEKKEKKKKKKKREKVSVLVSCWENNKGVDKRVTKSTPSYDRGDERRELFCVLMCLDANAVRVVPKHSVNEKKRNKMRANGA